MNNALPRVFVTREIPEVGLHRLRQFCEIDLWPELLPPDRQTLLARSAGCAGVLTMLSDGIDDEFLDAAGPELKVVSQYAVGYNNIDVKACNARGVKVGNTPGALTDATADMAFTLLIAAARRLVESRTYIDNGNWKTWEPMGHIGHDLMNQTIGIVGMGRIGQAMAKRCHGGWDMNVLYTARSPKPEADEKFGAKHVSFEELLEKSDFLSVHTDLNEQTKGMFDAKAFQKMKSTAIFVNTARGGVHVQSDLVDALKSGEIAAAGLDVTDPEPPAMDDPILSLPNCVIAPHIGSATVSTRDAMAMIAANHIIAGIQGEPLEHEVNV